MGFKIRISILNFFGILSVKKNCHNLAVSKLQMFFNLLKIFGFIFFGNLPSEIVSKSPTRLYTQANSTGFLKGITQAYYIQQTGQAVTMMMLQLIVNQRQVEIINRMILLRNKCNEIYEPSKRIFDRFEKSCWWKILCVFGFAFTSFMASSISKSEFSFPVVIAYTLLLYSSMMKIAFVCYFFAMAQFIVEGSRVIQICTKHQINNEKLTYGDLSKISELSLLRSELFRVKRKLIQSLSLQALSSFIYFVTQVVVRVRNRFIF